MSNSCDESPYKGKSVVRSIDSENLCTLARATNLASHMEVGRRGTRSSMRKEVVRLEDTNPNLRLTGNTPPKRKSGKVEGRNRSLLCETPFFTIACKKDGTKMRGFQCGICSRRTTFYCLGCHQYFCNNVPLRKKEDITEELKFESDVIEINLGTKRKWKFNGEVTSGGKLARRKIEVDFSVCIRSTCMNLAHKHKLKAV